ncbi:MAG: NAD(P)/FAD-dependent oxidoreductase [Gammaproteobacteria bacterium]
MRNTVKEYDLIILGSGLPGSILAAIIARMGANILIIEKGAHPRFAIGEAMLPQSTMWMLLLGERFNFPEINDITDVKRVNERVSKVCGQKRTISFLYHEEGKRQDLKYSHQIIAPEVPFSSESHFMRAEIDQHMVEVARKAGADYIDNTNVTEFDLKENDITLKTEDGDTYHARLLIDGSGFRSPVAEALELRQPQSSLRSHSRTIFNHCTGLKNYDELEGVVSPSKRYGYHDGTLHHVFDGGWFWVIPFDNTPISESNLASIGLSLDTSKYPLDESISPEKEFWSIVERYPSIQEHFEGLQPKRKWIRTGQIQYSSKRAAGKGWVMMSHAYGFIDALLSRGMINSFESVYYLANAIENAFKDDDYSYTYFEHLNEMQHEQIDATDRMVSTAYVSFSDFRLWNAWFNLWFGSKLLGDLYFMRGIVKAKSGDYSFYDRVNNAVRADLSAPFTEKVEELLETVESTQLAVKNGEMGIQEAADKVCHLVESADWLPHCVYHWGGPAGNADFSDEVVHELIMEWGRKDAPAWLRDSMFDFIPPWFPEAMDMMNKAHGAVGKP